MKEYLKTILGIVLFLIILLILGHIGGYFQAIVNRTYDALKFGFYFSLCKVLLIPLGITALGINHVLRAKRFDWRNFLIFFVAGLALLFNLFVYLPIPVLVKISLMKYSDMGAVVIGLGILLSLRGKKDTD